MADGLLASVLHLTDLHLGKDFTTTLSGPMRVLPGNWLVGTAHDKTVLRAVARGIDMARLHLRRRFDRPQDFDFDVTVVSGDILAQPFSPSPNSYGSFAYQWLTNAYPIDHRGHDIGLHLPAERLVVIPGNHDRMGLRDGRSLLGECLYAACWGSYPWHGRCYVSVPNKAIPSPDAHKSTTVCPGARYQ